MCVCVCVCVCRCDGDDMICCVCTGVMGMIWSVVCVQV